jgi:hypothetical protein
LRVAVEVLGPAVAVSVAELNKSALLKLISTTGVTKAVPLVFWTINVPEFTVAPGPTAAITGPPGGGMTTPPKVGVGVLGVLGITGGTGEWVGGEVGADVGPEVGAEVGVGVGVDAATLTAARSPSTRLAAGALLLTTLADAVVVELVIVAVKVLLRVALLPSFRVTAVGLRLPARVASIGTGLVPPMGIGVPLKDMPSAEGVK